MRETFSQENQPLAQRLLLESRALLQKFAPYALPKEPTILIFRSGRREPLYSTYCGPLRGIHYHFLNHKTSGLEEIIANKIKDRISFAHELVHQSHAEMMGPLLWWNEDLDAYISDEELASKPIEDIFRKLWEVEGPAIPSITDALTEGFAWLTEILVYEQYRKGFKYSVSRRQKRAEVSALKEIGKVYHERFYITKKADYDFHQKGFKFIRNLYETFGLKGVLDFLKVVDYEECNEITSQMASFDEMLADYRKIPLIDHP